MYSYYQILILDTIQSIVNKHKAMEDSRMFWNMIERKK